MEGQPRLSGASSPATPATLSDLKQHTHEHPDNTMGFEYSEQLLTPENSRSETSSNNEHAFHEEKPTLRRRSTRVARASLQESSDLAGDREPDTPGVPTPVSENDHPMSGEALAANVADGKSSRAASHLRHSIAVMESPLWAETTPAGENTDPEAHAVAPDTPVSKSSQEPQPGDMNSSLQQRTLRKRVERILTQEEGQDTAKASPRTKEEMPSPPRRSSRLSLLEKATDLIDRTSSVLGKRSRGVLEKGKELGRRASLRPRNVVQPKEEPEKSTNEPPAAKKRRVSESDLPAKIKENEQANQDEPTAPAPVTRYRPKRWLSHGLYSGQEPTHARPLQNKNNKTTKRRSLSGARRKLLPMPMFTGERLLRQGRDFTLPFDIFSPLPPGQPKPNEWRKTNKNVFVGEAGSIWRANKHLELSKCMCVEETGCDENCQNRYMFYECDDGNCGLGSGCGNRNFDELKQRTKAGGKYNIGVEVIKTADRGYGVRSNRTFDSNQIIVEYTGEIITQSECEKRMRSVYKTNECYYLMYFDQNMIIDATRGSIARFVNHSCQPNCRMEKWTVAGKPRMALFAGDRGVMTGEELTYDYNFDPYSQKNVQQCRCGSSNCRGILGPRPKEKEQRAKELEKQREAALAMKKTSRKPNGTRRKVGTVLNGSTSRITKKQKPGISRSIKSGVKKAISRARSSTAKATTSHKVTSPRGKKNGKASDEAKSGKDLTAKAKLTKAAKATPKMRKTTKDAPKAKKIQLPKVKATKPRAKAAVRVRKPTQTTKAKPATVDNSSTSQLKRPSAKVKARVLAAAKGTARKRTPKKDDTKGTPKKSPTKRAPKAKGSNERAKSTANSVKTSTV
ncbi:hypothetical protein FE257_008676 [Aspergillus nanangensis]|uniref:Histone-lysine N-methyltransferase n=1 Tax=Aspergillus nanangensis TaxID=2582783 RepID=A0AAD4CLF2_ASPNN|nr:hypothetical protein FE257_008676 [Aspergillus nanangensis]